ncbi:MAG: glycosyl transferase [Micavibrio sp.]|nr:MAG: glycosyl transferase [Micavibrio sp.]
MDISQKKILFITHAGNPGGAEYKMVKLCSAPEQNSEVMLFQNGHLEKILKENDIQFSICPMPPGMKSFRKEDGIISILKAIPSTFSMIRSVGRHTRKFDLVVCMSQKSFILSSLAKPITRKPIIWFMNDILSRDHFSRLLILLLVTLSRYSATHVVVNSQASLDAWEQAGGRKKNVSIIFPGTDENNIDEQIQDHDAIKAYKQKYSPDGKPLVGIFGRISHWKGQDVFLEAIAKVESINAIIVGDALFGEEEHAQALKNMTKELGIENRVIFTGHKDDIAKIMAACDIVAHCSTSPEPFGGVIVEAMMCGTPVIASDAGGAQEIVVHNETGQLTALKDSNALAQAIEKYINDPEWSALLAKNARKRAIENFSKRILIERFSEIVKIIEKPTTPPKDKAYAASV